MDKFYKYEILGTPYMLIKSYLISRTQQVKVAHLENNQVKDYLLTSLSVTCGVPQGSVLGALLFILYMNNIPHL
jgi:hypothetical protein